MPEPDQPELAIIAGPNGSGKSTFHRRHLGDRFPTFVNADEIAKGLDVADRSQRDLEAATMAEKRRHELVVGRESFALETVFSRSDYWLEFIANARRAGYRIFLFFLCTADPALNAGRVATRVAEGGHSVPIDKIQSRYAGSIRTAEKAVLMVDEFWLYDNSEWNRAPRLIAHLTDGVPDYASPAIPNWAAGFRLTR